MKVGRGKFAAFISKKTSEVANTELYKIIKALSRRLHFTHPRSRNINPERTISQEGAEFEDVICEYVDAIAIAKRIKNVNKRAVLVYKSMGYPNWKIALILGISERTVDNLVKSIKIFLRKVGGLATLKGGER